MDLLEQEKPSVNLRLHSGVTEWRVMGEFITTNDNI